MFEFQKLIDCERETGDSVAIIAVEEPLVEVTRSTEGKSNTRWGFLCAESRIIAGTDVILVGRTSA